MKKQITLLAAVLLLAGIVVLNHLPSPVQADVVTALDKKDLDSFGFTLDKPVNKPKIDQATAIDNAKKTFGDLTNGTTGVKADYQLATNHRFQGFSPAALEKNPELKAKKFMDQAPVYIITFTGATVQTFGPHDEDSTKRVHNVIHVVVDATSGEPLMAFSSK